MKRNVLEPPKAPKVLISHVTGNANSKQATLALAEGNLLAEVHTTLVWRPRPIWTALMPQRWCATLGKRAFPDAVQPFLRTHPWRELGRQARCRVGLHRWTWLGDIQTVAAAFDKAVSRSAARAETCTAVYAYMDAAEQTFRSAKQRHGLTFYELPTPYWRFTRDVVNEEVHRQPDWAMTLPALEEDDPVMLRRDRELQLADVILVPSLFVRDSLRLAPPFRGQVRVVPYGCPDAPTTPVVADRPPSRDKPLRVLFVGSLNQGKGLGYLAAALEGLERQTTLTIIGSRTSSLTCDVMERFLNKHRHLSRLTNEAVLAEMREHDVLVLPTLYEGLALVLLEAMAAGLTVITTEHSGLKGMITDGNEGFMVPVRDAGALRDRLQRLASDRELLAVMRASAQLWSRDHSWLRYRQQIRDVIAEFTPV